MREAHEVHELVQKPAEVEAPLVGENEHVGFLAGVAQLRPADPQLRVADSYAAMIETPSYITI